MIKVHDILRELYIKTRALNSIKDDRKHNYTSFEEMIKALQDKAKKGV